MVEKLRVKAPIPVIVIAWLLLLTGIFSLFATLPLLFIGGLAQNALFLGVGLLSLIKGGGLVAVSFGIRHLRRWALYVFTVVTILAFGLSAHSFLTERTHEIINYADLFIQVLALGYFWSISKKFS